MYCCEVLRRCKKQWKRRFKKRWKGKIQKKRRTILKVQNDFRFIRKNVSHLFSYKKNYNHNKIKPKILQKSMTNSYQQSHDDWRFMALDKCCCWLEEARWRKEKFKEQENRSRKEDKRFDWSRMKCSRSNTTGRSERVGWVLSGAHNPMSEQLPY